MLYKNKEGYNIPSECERIRGRVGLTFNPFSFSRRNCTAFIAPAIGDEIIFVIELDSQDQQKYLSIPYQKLYQLSNENKPIEHSCFFNEDKYFKQIQSVKIYIPEFDKLKKCPDEIIEFIEQQISKWEKMP